MKTMSTYYARWIVVSLSISVCSCHTQKKATSHHSRQPRFFDDIYMGNHNKQSATADAIDKAQKYPVRKKTPKPQPSATPAVSTNPNAAISEKYAQKLGTSPGNLKNSDLYEFIDAWYGVPYHLGGSEKTGIDCSGFSCRLYNEIYGIQLSHSAHEQYTNCTRSKNTTEAQEGDLVFFKTLGKRISHVGIYLWNDYFVHASSSQGIVISSLHEEYWEKHFVCTGKVTH